MLNIAIFVINLTAEYEQNIENIPPANSNANKIIRKSWNISEKIQYAELESKCLQEIWDASQQLKTLDQTTPWITHREPEAQGSVQVTGQHLEPLIVEEVSSNMARNLPTSAHSLAIRILREDPSFKANTPAEEDEPNKQF